MLLPFPLDNELDGNNEAGDNKGSSNQKKFDLRIYFLIASIDPLIVLYHDGYLRVALDAYNSNINDTNKRGHLTNAKIQKDHNMYVYNQQKESKVVFLS